MLTALESVKRLTEISSADLQKLVEADPVSAFASKDDVHQVAEVIGHRAPLQSVRVQQWIAGTPVGHSEDFRFELRMSPGTLAVARRGGQNVGMEQRFTDKLESCSGCSFSNGKPHKHVFTQDGEELQGQGALFEVDEEPEIKRGAVTEWSAKSRARMYRTIAELDYAGWKNDGGNLAMVSYTLPGPWQLIAPKGRDFKALIDKLRKRWLRNIGPWRGLWKLEFQQRGAPHLHTLMRVPALVRGVRFEEWISKVWADLCLAQLRKTAAPILVWHYEQVHYRRHLGRGVDVSLSGVRFDNPRKTAIYFGKHSSKTMDSKEYQHIVPELWQQEGSGPGRFWGVWGLERAAVSVVIPMHEWHLVRRQLRKQAKSRLAVNEINKLRWNRRSGEIWRLKKPRYNALKHQGGWVMSADGLELALGLVEWLDQLKQQRRSPAQYNALNRRIN